MIPKTIHYCWFGRGEKPKSVKKCIKSWKKFCPDYEIIEWNEDNFDLDFNEYTRYCYDNKKFAFLSDFARLIIVAKEGGIYFDTDVEVLKPFDDLLAFDAFYGFENDENVNTGHGFGAVKGHKTVESMKEQYLKLERQEDGTFPLVVCPKLNTDGLLPFGLKKDGSYQNLDGAVVLTEDYFNPLDDATGKLKKTENTYSIHWYSKSWMSKGKILRSKLTRPFHRLFGKDCFKFLKK